MFIFLLFLIFILRADLIVNQIDISSQKGVLNDTISGRFDNQGGSNDIILLSEYNKGAVYTHIDSYYNIDHINLTHSHVWDASRQTYESIAYDLNRDGFDEFILLGSQSYFSAPSFVSKSQRIQLYSPYMSVNFNLSNAFQAKDRLSVVDINSDKYLDIIASEVKDDNSLYLYTLINTHIIYDAPVFKYFDDFEQTLDFHEAIFSWGFTHSSSLNSQVDLFVFFEDKFQVFSFSDSSSFDFEQEVLLPTDIRNIDEFFPLRKRPDIGGVYCDFAVSDFSDNSLQLYFNQEDHIDTFIPVLNEQLSGYTLKAYYVPEMFDRRIAAYYQKDNSTGGLLVLYTCKYSASLEKIVLISDYQYRCSSQPLKVSYQTFQNPLGPYRIESLIETSPAFWSLVFDSEVTCLFYQ